MVQGFQSREPVAVYNGPERDYKVAVQVDGDDTYTQLFGLHSNWLDAFGRLRISDPQSLFEGGFAYDLSPQFFEAITATSGTVTHDDDLKSAILTAATASGSSAALQSREYIPYERGKSQLIKITFVFGAAVANVRKRAGYFDAENGFYFEQTGDGIRMVRRSSTTGSLVNTAIEQSSWNLDTLDGEGPSGVTLDMTKAQIFVIDGQWLGVGRVRVGFNIDGATYYVHEFLHANTATVAPYTQSFTLPVRWEIESTAASDGDTLQAICTEVESEGGFESPVGMVFAAVNPSSVATSTTRTAVLSIRPATEYPASSGIVNRQTIEPLSWDVLALEETSLVEVFYNSTLSGGTWTRADDHSAVEYGVGQTITTPGTLVNAYFVAAGSGPKVAAASEQTSASQYPLTLDAAGANPRAMTICVTTLTGTGTAQAVAAWKEIR